MSFDLQLKGLRALVTGGTKGIGAAVVEGLRTAGVQVMATARSAPAQSTMDVTYVAADLSTTDGAATVARSVLERWGGVDILVNVLGGSSAPGGGFAALDDAQWLHELNQNLMPAVRLDRALLPSMLAQGSGVIIQCQLDSTPAATAGIDDRLRGCQGGFVNVQQGIVERGDAEGRARTTCLARVGRDRSLRRAGRASGEPGRDGLRRWQANHHGQSRRDSTRQALEAE